MQNILQNTHKKAEKAEETQNAEEAEKAQNAGKAEKAINTETPERQKRRILDNQKANACLHEEIIRQSKAEPRVIKKQMLVSVKRLSGSQKQNPG